MQAGPAHRAPGRIPGSARRSQSTGREAAMTPPLSRSVRFRLPGDPRGRAPAPYHRVREHGGGAAGQAPAAAGGAGGRAPAAAPGAAPGPGPRRRAGRGQRGLAAAVPGPAAPAVAGPALVAAQGLPLTWRRSRPVGVGLVIGAARVAYDKIGFGFAPFPLGPAIAFYTIIDRRGPVWRWIACLLVAAGIAVSESSPGHAQPYDDHLPGDDLPHRRGGGPAQPGQAGQHPDRAEPGRPRRGGSSTVSPRRPRSASGPGSPASCTMSWRTTSA